MLIGQSNIYRSKIKTIYII